MGQVMVSIEVRSGDISSLSVKDDFSRVNNATNRASFRLAGSASWSNSCYGDETSRGGTEHRAPECRRPLRLQGGHRYPGVLWRDVRVADAATALGILQRRQAGGIGPATTVSKRSESRNPPLVGKKCLTMHKGHLPPTRAQFARHTNICVYATITRSHILR